MTRKPNAAALSSLVRPPKNSEGVGVRASGADDWSTGSSVGAASAISVRKGGMGMTFPSSGGSSVGFSSVGSRFLSSSDSPKPTAFEAIGAELWAAAASGITASHRPSTTHRLHVKGERRRIGIVYLLLIVEFSGRDKDRAHAMG